MSTVHLITTDNQREKNVKVLVCQRGARHRYAIPRLLEEAGMLAAIYTDSCAHSPVGRMASLLPFLAGKVPAIQALTARKPNGIPSGKIFSSDNPIYSTLSNGLVSPDLSSVYKNWGLKGGNAVYSMYGEDMGFLKWAKERGAKIIIDVFISPLSNQVVFGEQANFDAPACYRVEASECAYSAERGIGACAPLADILLCPSEWVADGVRKFVPDHAHKIRVVPYGSSIQPKAQKEVKKGRILFAGRDPLRKGLPYLAEAAHHLRQAGMELDVRVAGLDKRDCDWFPHHQELNCLGLVEMAGMGAEFSKCDAFVLPSLSEGQAGVILEALSYGCPVIATRESGVDLANNENGILVSAGSSGGLVDAISRVVKDRPLRDRLSVGGKDYFEASFSMDMWKKRLVSVMKELLPEN